MYNFYTAIDEVFMMWNRQDFRRRPEEFRRDPSEVAKSVSEDTEAFLAKGGKIKLIPISQKHKNVMTKEYRLEEAERLNWQLLSGGLL